jgi:chromosome segregation ATPase
LVILFRMSRLFALLITVFLTGVLWAGPDDDFVEIYQLIQQTDAQRENGRFTEARAGYERAKTLLLALKKGYPEWNERVIAYRLRYVAEKLAVLPAVDPAAPPGSAPGATAETLPEGEVLTQFRNLHGEITQLRGEKQRLEAKLREALTAQPAPVDPKELQAAVERITQLQSTNRALAEKLETQQAERRNLVEKVLVDEAQQALQAANQQLTAQAEKTIELEGLRNRAEAELKRLQSGEISQLQTQNQALKSQVNELATSTDRGEQIANLAERVAKLQSGLQESRAQNEVLLADRAKLERQVEDLRARQSEESLVRTRQLETDLALARAEGERQSVRAIQLEDRLKREQGVRGTLELDNRSLSNRVAELTGKVEDLQSAEIQLQAEKEERLELEAQLKAAEQQLAAVPLTGPASPLSPAADPVLTARAQALETEAIRLRDALRESRTRQNELLALVAESEKSRARWERERQELLASLSALQKSPAQQQLARATASISTLEDRVRRLEKERDTLARRLDDATRKSRAELQQVRKNRMGTPREEAARFRLERN